MTSALDNCQISTRGKLAATGNPVQNYPSEDVLDISLVLANSARLPLKLMSKNTKEDHNRVVRLYAINTSLLFTSTVPCTVNINCSIFFRELTYEGLCF